MITVTSLIYYPIKACRGFEVEYSLVERMGMQHDRRMMVTTSDGEFLTQREYPKLALVTPTLRDGVLELSAPEFDSLRINIQNTGASYPVNVWKSKGVAAVDQGRKQRSGSPIGWKQTCDWFTLPMDSCASSTRSMRSTKMTTPASRMDIPS
ncbi:MAG: MOSC domain-containing protein [Anaerolineales bacterium]